MSCTSVLGASSPVSQSSSPAFKVSKAMGFPQTVGSRSPANIRASHWEVVGTVLSSLPALLKRKTSVLAFLCFEASALVQTANMHRRDP